MDQRLRSYLDTLRDHIEGTAIILRLILCGEADLKNLQLAIRYLQRALDIVNELILAATR